MAYIAPNSTVYLCRKVPFKNDYQHTTIFEDATAQYNYFYSKRKYTFTEQSYQRKDNGVIRLNVLSDNIIDCNYMMFRNTNFSNKWFYAFITNVEYVNNSVSNVYYEIDVMQTWLFNYNLRRCFVEREHTISDNPGEHRVPEDIPVNPYYIYKLPVDNCPFTAGQYAVVVATGSAKTPGGGGDNLYPCVSDNLFSGVDYTVYQNPGDAYAALKELNTQGRAEEVVAVYQVPRAFLGAGNPINHFTTVDVGLTITNGLQQYYEALGSYAPHNMKLFTQQFYGLLCRTSQGETATYAYEYFDNPRAPSFLMHMSGVGTPEATLVPYKYKGTNAANLTEALNCTDFPMCSYSNDSFKAWLALNQGSIMSSALSVFNLSAGGGTSRNASMSQSWSEGGNDVRGAYYESIGNTSNTNFGVNPRPIITTAGMLIDAAAMPRAQKGSAGSALSYKMNNAGYTFYMYYLQEDDAKRIDHYFDMYGYAINDVKIPNTYSRPHWNYVKTRNCLIYAVDGDSIPDDDVNKICAVYNKGVTFWKKPEEVGQYQLDNSPT